MIKITQKAQLQLKVMMHTKKLSTHHIRVGVRGEKNCAPNYYLGIQKEPLPDDKQYQIGDLKIVMDSMSALRMKDIELDYIDLSEHSGFVFRNNSDRNTTISGNCAFE